MEMPKKRSYTCTIIIPKDYPKCKAPGRAFCAAYLKDLREMKRDVEECFKKLKE